MVPKDIHALNIGTCEYIMLHGKRDFADVINIKDIKRRLPWIT